ncbi:DMT family transporter [Psychromonas ossibalaenae]|uniref:DMT family transporter n=1 Tax=Psychromonas ossibalaenae TaxID=444922 RepID=UPI00036923A4|nr:DMT family transporter [Psychromonas ossibalaenae]
MKSLYLPQQFVRLPKAELMLILVAVFWGTSYGVSKQALAFISVTAFLAVRFLLTFFLLLPVFISDYKKGKTKNAWIAVPSGILLLLIFTTEAFGVLNTSASNAVVLVSLCVIMTPFVEWFAFRTKPDKKLFVLCTLAFSGVLLLTVKSGFSLSFNKGDMLILLAAVLRAFMVVYTKKLMQGRGLPILSLTMLQSGIIGFGALFVLLLSNNGGIPELPNEAQFWWLTLYLVLFCTIFAFFAQNYALSKTSASNVSVLMGSEPLFGILFAMIFLGEALLWYQYLGALLIVLVTLYASLSDQSKDS